MSMSSNGYPGAAPTGGVHHHHHQSMSAAQGGGRSSAGLVNNNVYDVTNGVRGGPSPMTSNGAPTSGSGMHSNNSYQPNMVVCQQQVEKKPVIMKTEFGEESPAVVKNEELRLVFPHNKQVLLKPFEINHDAAREDVTFFISESMGAKIKHPQHSSDMDILLKCTHKNDPSTYDIPEFVTVILNGTKLDTESSRSSIHSCHKPFLLPKNLCNVGNNDLTIQTRQCCCLFTFELRVVHRPTVAEALRTLLQKRHLNMTACKQQIRRVFEKKPIAGTTNSTSNSDATDRCGAGSDSSPECLEQTAITVPLVCPLTKQLMNNPCRGEKCEHIQCFDLESYLRANSDRLFWKCPICKQPAFIEHVIIDEYLANIINQCKNTDVREVTIDADANWRPASSGSGRSQPHIKSEAEPGDDVNGCYGDNVKRESSMLTGSNVSSCITDNRTNAYTTSCAAVGGSTSSSSSLSSIRANPACSAEMVDAHQPEMVSIQSTINPAVAALNIHNQPLQSALDAVSSPGTPSSNTTGNKRKAPPPSPDQHLYPPSCPPTILQPRSIGDTSTSVTSDQETTDLCHQEKRRRCTGGGDSMLAPQSPAGTGSDNCTLTGGLVALETGTGAGSSLTGSSNGVAGCSNLVGLQSSGSSTTDLEFDQLLEPNNNPDFSFMDDLADIESLVNDYLPNRSSSGNVPGVSDGLPGQVECHNDLLGDSVGGVCGSVGSGGGRTGAAQDDSDNETNPAADADDLLQILNL